MPHDVNGNPLGVLRHANGATEKVPLNLLEASVVGGIKVPSGVLVLGTPLALKSRKGLR